MTVFFVYKCMCVYVYVCACEYGHVCSVHVCVYLGRIEGNWSFVFQLSSTFKSMCCNVFIYFLCVFLSNVHKCL